MADKDNRDSDSEEEVEQTEEATPEVQEDATLNNPDVVTKYQEAAKIAQAVLIELAARCVPGAKIHELCKFGDDLILSRVGAIYNKKTKAGKLVLKGIAFPVCLSVNDVICHCSPLPTDTSVPDLAENDMVKIDLGVHLDGFIAVVAHTVVVPGAGITPEEQAKRDNVVNAAYTAAEVAVRLMKPGNTNTQVSQAIKKVADAFDVRPISGTLMHQMKQFVIDGNKMILLREEADQKVELCTFEAGEVYAIDIAMSTGEGKPREIGSRTTVYKRQVDRKYALKTQAARKFLKDVNKTSPTLPFSIRGYEDEKIAKMGVRECVNHDLLVPYPILNEHKEDFVGHVKVTVLLLPSGNTAQITGLAPYTYLQGKGDAADATRLSASLPVGLALSESLTAKGVALPEDIVTLLQQSPVESKKKAKKSAAANKKAAAATAGAAEKA